MLMNNFLVNRLKEIYYGETLLYNIFLSKNQMFEKYIRESTQNFGTFA